MNDESMNENDNEDDNEDENENENKVLNIKDERDKTS